MSGTTTITIGNMKAEKKDPKKLIEELWRDGLEYQSTQRQQWVDVAQSYHGFLANKVRGRSNFHHHKIFPQVERATARGMQYFFRSKPYVSITATGEAFVEQARNHERVLQHYYETCPVYYLEKTRHVKYGHMYGASFMVPSWKNITRKVTVQIPQTIGSGDMSFVLGYTPQEVDVRMYDGLWFKTYSPWEVVFDPWSRYPRWRLVEEFVHYTELLDMARQGQYDAAAVDAVPLNADGQSGASFIARQTAIGRPALKPDKEIVRLQHLFFADHFYTLANGAVIIRDTDNWYDHGEVPVVQSTFIVDPDSSYGMATGSLMLPGQKMINVVDNLTIDHVMQSVNWQWKYRQGVDPNQLLGLPNHRIGPLKNMDDVDIVVPPEIKHDLLLIGAGLSNAMDEMVGYYSAQKGSGEGPANTATSDQIFQQEGNVRIASDTRNYEELSGIPEAKQSSKNVAQMMPDEIEVSVEDVGGQAFERLSRDQIQGEFAYRASGASDTINKAVAQQQVMEFFALAKDAQQYVMLPTGQIVPMPVQNNYEVIREFYESIGKRNVNRMLYNPNLFGQPLDNSLLGQVPPQMPSYLQRDPLTGALRNPAGAPSMQSGGGLPGGGTLNPTKQVANMMPKVHGVF